MTDRDYNLLKVIISKFIIDIFVNCRLFKAVRLSQGRDEYNGTPPGGSRKVQGKKHIAVCSPTSWPTDNITSTGTKKTKYCIINECNNL